MIVGAVLVQNTAWSNVEKAIANFGDRLNPQFVLDADIAELADVIRSAGFFNQKAAYLKAVTAWFGRYNFDVTIVQREPLEKLRPELLSVKGIGKETADSILLYGFEFPTFVIDAYTMRLCGRYAIDAGKGYDAFKAHFEANIPRDVNLYNNYHAVIVYLCKDFCRKSKPLCDKCPLYETCEKIKV
jgi:endonuclease-3 related protein